MRFKPNDLILLLNAQEDDIDYVVKRQETRKSAFFIRNENFF
jgi:hypothetical protein